MQLSETRETEQHETLLAEALAYGPYAVAHRSDGKTVFVEGAAPGDTAEVAYTGEKDRFATARVVRIIEPGPARVSIPSDLAGMLHAAPWAHVAYDMQLTAKRNNVVESLVRIGGVDREAAENLVGMCVPSKKQLHYRNKLELSCSTDAAGRLVVGFATAVDGASEEGDDAGNRGDGNDGGAIGRMGLAHKAIQDAPKKLQGALRYVEGGQPGRLGVHRIGVRHSTRTGACEVALWTTPGAFPRKEAARTIGDALFSTSIVRVIADAGKARAVKRVEVLAGEGSWHEQLAGFTLRASAPSFFQVNSEQTEILIELVVDGLDIQNQAGQGLRIADLYCGVGTFTLPFAQLGCDVAAVESAGSAVRDLRRNVEEAGLYVDVIGGDSARELDTLGHLDALVVDPPRAGLAQGIAESIAAAGPKRVAYVSCDPATWARDVARLAACGYTLESATPVDLFPHTYHCELVSLFVR